tara:strand:+ start:322 stop:1332 length:1011 start_codon:yes stop_codon:yes gene_type:complete
LKVLYYVTDHGLGHATRTVAIVRELAKKKTQVTIRSTDPTKFLKKSLPGIKIINGQTDFGPVMCKKNGMLFDENKTRVNLSSWISKMPDLIKKEMSIFEKEKPDLIISDVSFMPILAASQNNIKSILVSSFVWNESLNVPRYKKNMIKDSYKKAHSIISLPLGTPMKFKNRVSAGIVARFPTSSKNQIRRSLGIKKGEKLVLVSLSGVNKINLKHSSNVRIIDLSDYSSIRKNNGKNLVEGQNLINAADLVICKCGYGFISECLTNGIRFCYVLESKHKEANAIHKSLQKMNLKNRITINSILQKEINNEFISTYKIVKKPFDNQNIVKKIINIVK